MATHVLTPAGTEFGAEVIEVRLSADETGWVKFRRDDGGGEGYVDLTVWGRPWGGYPPSWPPRVGDLITIVLVPQGPRYGHETRGPGGRTRGPRSPR